MALWLSFMNLNPHLSLEMRLKKVCRRCKALYDYTRDMNKDLSDDFAERRRTEDNGKVDLVKYAGFSIITIVGL